MRIVCLVPSLTEYLWALGLEEEVVGITKFCVHPSQWFENKTRVGGTKNVNFSKISQLQPDLIIANKEENTKEDIERLGKDFKLLLTEIEDVADAIAALKEIGGAVGSAQKAKQIVNEIETSFAQLQGIFKGQSFLYFIWNDPCFLAGTKTYIHSFLTHFGLKNACNLERYPSLDAWQTEQASLQKDPDYIFLSSEPFPFEAKYIEAFQQLFPSSKIILIDGEMCAWYGSRMLDAAAYMQQLAHTISVI
jgi:ABC-type Fe3+-hydroxamate transport system substrate-binding protein